MPADLPSTPQSAPPNFYSQVGAMASGPGGGAGQPGAGNKPGAAPPMDADHEFLSTVNTLLGVLAKIGQMQPRGQDITKYTQAAADAMKECVKVVFGADATATPGTDGSAAAAVGQPAAADTGTGSGAGAAMMQ